MKTVLTALNARYSHSNLALAYLKKHCSDFDIIICEYTINDDVFKIYADLLEKKAKVYCFSLYIWNTNQTLNLAQMIKIAMPDAVIIFGGPECSYNSEEFLQRNSFADYVVAGVGENALRNLLLMLKNGEKPPKIIRANTDLDEISFPYSKESIERLKNKIIYFETSRGCPFNCTYCLSSACEGVRYFSMDYVKHGLKFFFDNNVPLVKLIDRTFNSDIKRAIEIIRFIIENSNTTKVHLEVAPHLLNDEMINLLNSAPKDMFQLEMGIQTTNEKSLTAINRRFNFDISSNNIKKLKRIHIHLDLIAGLPYEDYDSFSRSFNDVFSLKPSMLQLGFLKVLHGTKIAERTDIYSVAFAPYEVLHTKWLSAEELCKLKQIENAVERFYNSGAFSKTIEYLTKDDAFKLFEALSEALKSAEANGPLPRVKLYNLLYENFGDKIKNLLISDFLINNKDAKLPSFVQIDAPKSFKQKCYAYLKRHNIEVDFKDIRFEAIENKILFVNYNIKEIFDITNELSSCLTQ